MNQEPLPPPALEPTTRALVDLLDQVVNSGAVAVGDLLLSVAEVDLIRLEVRLALKGAEEPAGPHQHQPAGPRTGSSPTTPPGAPAAQPANTRPAPNRLGRDLDQGVGPGRRRNADPPEVQRSLAALVLTLVDVLQELMERQAVRRMDSESLSEEEIERLGQTFLALRQRMDELKDTFGIRTTQPDAQLMSWSTQ